MSDNFCSNHRPVKSAFLQDISRKSKISKEKYEISGNLRIYVIFGLQLQALHLSYTDVLCSF